MSYLMLIRAIIIHGPDFFVSTLTANERDLRLRDAGQDGAPLRDDVVGKLMREAARVGVRGRAAIDFLQRNGSSRVVNIRQKPCGGQICAFDGKVAVGNHVRTGGSVR